MRVAERHRLRSSVAPPTVIPTLERPLLIIMAVREKLEIPNSSMCLIAHRQFWWKPNVFSTSSVSEGLYLTRSLAYASGYYFGKSAAVQPKWASFSESDH